MTEHYPEFLHHERRDGPLLVRPAVRFPQPPGAQDEDPNGPL